MSFRRPLKSVVSGYTKKGALDLEKAPYFQREQFYAKYRKNFPEQPSLTNQLKLKHQKYKLQDIKIVEQDLVYINDGPGKGTFSKVLLYLKDNDSYLLEGVTKPTPSSKDQWVEGQTSFLMDLPTPVPRKNIKLAAKDKDEKGNLVYLVAEDIVMKDKYYDELYGCWLPRRFVKYNEKYEIPWPKPIEIEPDSFSTTEDVALERTYELQSIGRPPVPVEMLSELRNPYSKHKKRFLSEYQARVMRAPDMPLTEAQRAYLAKKASQQQQEQHQKKLMPLSEEIKNYIGEKMATHLNQIENPSLLAHLDDLSKIKTPHFAEIQQKINNS